MVAKDESNKDDLKSLWKSICDEVKETHDINLNKLIGQIFLIGVIVFAISSILSLNIGSNVETKTDSISDSGNYNIKNVGVVSSDNNKIDGNNMQESNTNGYSNFNSSSPIRDVSYVFNAALGSTLNYIDLLVLLAVVGIALSIVMGTLFQFGRIIGSI
jgi:hypothetical protein